MGTRLCPPASGIGRHGTLPYENDDGRNTVRLTRCVKEYMPVLLGGAARAFREPAVDNAYTAHGIQFPRHGNAYHSSRRSVSSVTAAPIGTPSPGSSTGDHRPPWRTRSIRRGDGRRERQIRLITHRLDQGALEQIDRFQGFGQKCLAGACCRRSSSAQGSRGGRRGGRYGGPGRARPSASRCWPGRRRTR